MCVCLCVCVYVCERERECVCACTCVPVCQCDGYVFVRLECKQPHVPKKYNQIYPPRSRAQTRVAILHGKETYNLGQRPERWLRVFCRRSHYPRHQPSAIHPIITFCFVCMYFTFWACHDGATVCIVGEYVDGQDAMRAFARLMALLSTSLSLPVSLSFSLSLFLSFSLSLFLSFYLSLFLSFSLSLFLSFSLSLFLPCFSSQYVYSFLYRCERGMQQKF